MEGSSLSILNRIESECKLTGLPFLILTLIDGDGQVTRELVTKSQLDGLELDLRDLSLPIDTHQFLQRSLQSRGDSIIHSFPHGSENRTIVFEVIKPKNSLLIFGAGHVGRAVAQIGYMIGYDVTIVDDRLEYLTDVSLSLNGLKRIHSSFDSVSNQLEISPLTAVVIVTRGHQHDEVCLKTVLTSNAAYIGLIGSKRRVRGVFQRIQYQGFSNLELNRVFAPIGLSIHAKTPQEIAIAILAQIIQVMNNVEVEAEYASEEI